MAGYGNRLATLGVALLLQGEPSLAGEQPALTFTNPLYRGADPWIAQRDGHYYLSQSGPGQSIIIWKSSSLTQRGQGNIVWQAPRWGWNCAQIWAPELHYLNGRWYIYYAASTGDNADHRMGVLESRTDDPQGPYLDRGMLYTGDDIAGRKNNRWAIDGTVLQIHSKLYFIWSGWEDQRDIQSLYIARMENPWTIASNRVKLCANDTYTWERVSESPRQRGLHEGPAALRRNGKIYLTYSCSGSWQASYKLGLLVADENADPMDPASWTKLPRPVFAPTADVFGVGHCSFVTSPDGKEDWIVYHAKTEKREGWRREVRMQPFIWQADGLPEFGTPIPSGQPLPLPSGQGAKAPEHRPPASQPAASRLNAPPNDGDAPFPTALAS